MAYQNHLALFEAPHQVRLVEQELPAPGPGEVAVRIHACGICTFEQRLYTGASPTYPFRPGHEAAGEVVAVGDDVVLDVKPGDRVALALLGRCGQCYYCRTGQSDLCVNAYARPQHGEPPTMGGLGEYLVVPAYKVYKMTNELPYEAAAFSEPLACAVHSVNKAKIKLAEDVVVLGAGTMGQLHVLLARLRGARVIVSEPQQDKREVAAAHGAHVVIDPTVTDPVAKVKELTDGRGADVVFITVGAPKVSEQALQMVRKGGRVVFYSAYVPKVEMPITLDDIHHRQWQLVGAVNQTTEDWLEATRLLSLGLVDVSHLISGQYDLHEIGPALEHATDGKSFRVIVRS